MEKKTAKKEIEKWRTAVDKANSLNPEQVKEIQKRYDKITSFKKA